MSATPSVSVSSFINLWITEGVLSWPSTIASYRRRDDEPGKRQHELIRHVDGLLKGSPSTLTLADAVEDINKAIDQRIARLQSQYSLRDLKAAFNNDHHSDILASLGVIRPLMVEEINQIRNRVNHEDADPPSADTCRRHAEFAWYFLRSTDITTRVESIRLNYEEPARPSAQRSAPPGRLSITLVPSTSWDGTCQISVPGALLQTAATAGYIRLTVETLEASAFLAPGIGLIGNTDGGAVSFNARTLCTPPQKRLIAETAMRLLSEI